jgi:hypothetical protein
MMATSTLRGVDGRVSAKVVGEEGDAVVVGRDLGVELGDGEVFPTVYPNGGEEGIVGLVEASEKILDKLFLVDWPACCGQLICVALHLVEELLRRHVVLPRPCEGDAEIGDPCSGLGGKHHLDCPPDFCCRVHPDGGDEDVRREGVDEEGEDMLVHGHPRVVGGVGLAGCLAIFFAGDVLRRWHLLSLDIAQ